jgi:hypothetical protein
VASGTGRTALGLAGAAAAGVLVYLGAAHVLRLPELADVGRRLRARAGRES